MEIKFTHNSSLKYTEHNIFRKYKLKIKVLDAFIFPFLGNLPRPTESNVNKGQQRKVDICFLFLLLLNSFYGGKVKSFSAVCFLPTAKHRHKNLLGGSGPHYNKYPETVFMASRKTHTSTRVFKTVRASCFSFSNIFVLSLNKHVF